MSLHMVKCLLACTVLSLTACAQQSNLHQAQHQIDALNKNLQVLSQHAAALKQQNALNAQSEQGAYLLPDAGTPVLLKSRIGLLEIALITLSPSTDGISVSLSVQQKDASFLPPLTGSIAWQTDRDSSLAGNAEITDGQQDFSTGSDLKSGNTRTVTVTLRGLTPQTLRWIRIHNIHPQEQLTGPVSTE